MQVQLAAGRKAGEGPLLFTVAQWHSAVPGCPGLCWAVSSRNSDTVALNHLPVPSVDGLEICKRVGLSQTRVDSLRSY